MPAKVIVSARRRHPVILLPMLILVAAAAAVWPAHATAASAPSLRLIAAGPEITLNRHGRDVPLDLGVYVASVGGDFELHVARPDYDTPAVASQVDGRTGKILRALPAELLDGWFGLNRFIRVAFFNDAGAIVAVKHFRFCPNSFARQRIDDRGPTLSRYPVFCDWQSPFLKGMVWGIDAHWAAPTLNSGFDELGGPSLRVPEGRYTVSVRIAQPYAELFGVPPEQAEVRLNVTVISAWDREMQRAITATADARIPARAADVPTVAHPRPSTLPDLVALPAWRMEVSHRKRRDFLSFAASPWNAGPGPLVIEGFRRPGEAVMDAYQYFYDAEGDATGRAPIGTLQYDPRRGHEHWHFLQFASFQILTVSQQEVVRSRKQAFCLFPTDVIDLTVRGSNWSPWSFGLSSACGGPNALWVREDLDAGWADTYHQNVPGQSFDITRLPNGRYYVRVQVNPLGTVRETTTANNTELRLIRLGGLPGRRTVVDEPWHGIDP
jgi:hypothetical protein